jgi:AraC-like DNA-binding protein
MNVKKIRKSLKAESSSKRDVVRSVPMNHPQLKELRKKNILSCGIDRRYEKSYWGMGEEIHSSHLLFYVVDGGVVCNDSIIAKKGELMVCPANRPRYFKTEKQETILVWVHLLKSFNIKKITDDIKVEELDHTLLMFQLMEMLLLETHSASSKSDDSVLHLSNLLLHYVFEKSSLSMYNNDIENKLTYLWLKVSSALDSDWSIKKLADEFKMSESNFHRIVMKIQNKSPMAIVQEMRMERASMLLKTTQLPLDDIADQIGYSNAYTFSHTFLNYSGKRPGRFRREE